MEYDAIVEFNVAQEHTLQRLRSYLEQEDWDLSDNAYEDMGGAQTFSEIHKLKVTNLLLNNTNNKGIIREIVNVKFPNLKFLSLQSNGIHTIQNLCFQIFPSLQDLWLEDNYLCSLKSIRKLYAPALIAGQFLDNFINNGYHLVEYSCPRQRVGFGRKQSKRACIQDISWIMKLENHYLEIIEFVSPSQINQGKVVDMCERKFKSQIEIIMKSE